MARALRFDEVQQRSVHNAYLKHEQLVDQLVAHKVRDLELDVHRWSQLGCPDTPPPDWGIYHTIGELGTNVCKVSEALRLLRTFHDAAPSHEVVTVHLELKSRGSGEAVGVFDDHSADDFDATILQVLGRSHVFTPADLLAANPGAPTLLAAVGRGAGGAGGWPTTDRLRGRFILVVHGEAEVDSYATGANAASRVCFLMRESLWQDVERVRANPHVVVHGEVDPARARALREAVPGLLLRSTQQDDAAGFAAAQVAGVNLILTDRVDVHLDPFARTHNDHGYPFARAGLAGAAAREAPDVRDRRERDPLVVVTTHSGDVAGTADSLTFVRSTTFPPSAAVGSPDEDVWSALLAAPSNTTVDSWGACFLMARASLDPSAPFVAVGRAADSHGVVARWRERPGAPTSQVELGDLAVRRGSLSTHVDRENVPWVRLRLTSATSATVHAVCEASADGHAWHAVAVRDLAGPLDVRGLAACGRLSRQADIPGVELVAAHLRRNGHLPVDLTVHGVGTADVSRVALVGERPRHRAVSVSVLDRTDSEVVLRSEQRPGPSRLCHADERLFTWTDVAVVSTVAYRAVAHDYDAPLLRWTVGGRAVPATGHGDLSVPVAGRSVRLRFAVDAAAAGLTLTTTADDGAYALDVVARVTEQDGTAPTSSPSVRLVVDGRRSGFTAEYAQFLRGCLRAAVDDLHVPPVGGLDPRPPVSLGRDAGRIDPVDLAAVLDGADLVHAADAADLRQLADRLGRAGRPGGASPA